MLQVQLKNFARSLFPAGSKTSGTGPALSPHPREFLVAGAPGTGKTFQLTELINFLVSDIKIEPSKILVFCFNRKWAKILRESTVLKAGRSILEIPIMSFFSFCSDFLKDYFSSGDETGILNAPTQWKILKEIITEKIDHKNYPITSGYLASGEAVLRSFVQEVFDFILRAQENLVKPEMVLDARISGNSGMIQELGGIYMNYLQHLKSNDFYNYGRLLTDTVDILNSDENARREVQEKYHIVLVDDFAETNRAQNEIINLTGKNGIIYFGNDNESVFAFRGSTGNNFSRLLGKATEGSGNFLLLDKNYRSRPEINRISNEFLGLNKLKERKDLFLCSAATKQPEDGGFVLKQFRNILDEANFICSSILRLTSSEGIKPEDICILVKGLSYKTGLLENVLNRSQIPFSRRSSRTVLDNPFVQLFIKIARLATLMSPKKDGSGNEAPDGKKSDAQTGRLLASVLTSGLLNMNSGFLLNIISEITPEGSKGKDSCSYFDKIRSYIKEKKDESPGLGLFMDALDDLSAATGLSAFDFLFRLFSDSRIKIKDFIFSGGCISDAKHESTLNVIGDFLQAAQDFTAAESNGIGSIGSFLDYLDDLSGSSFLEEMEESAKETSVAGNINILSFHQSKGLEFDAVFVPFINKNYLPSLFSVPQLYDTGLFDIMNREGKDREGDPAAVHLEQERQLLYLGLTRAKKYLCVTSCSSEEKSLFFEELAGIYRTAGLSSGKNGVSGKAVTDYIGDFANSRWLARKKAVVSAYRYERGKFTDSGNFLKLILFLKKFYPAPTWWINILPSSNKNNPFKSYKNIFSYSSLDTYMKCPLKYKFRYFFRLKEPENMALNIGSIYHEILKKFFTRTDGPDLDILLEIVRNEIENADFGFEFLKKEVLGDALENFEKFYLIHIADEKFSGLVEKSFMFNLADNCIYGRIDQIKFMDDESAEITDFKSGSKNISGETIKKDIQLPIYRLAVDLSGDLDMLKGKEIMLKYIFLGDKNCSQVIYPADFYDYREFSGSVLNMIKSIKKEMFRAGPENSYECRNCAFGINCGYNF